MYPRSTYVDVDLTLFHYLDPISIFCRRIGLRRRLPRVSLYNKPVRYWLQIDEERREEGIGTYRNVVVVIGLGCCNRRCCSRRCCSRKEERQIRGEDLFVMII